MHLDGLEDQGGLGDGQVGLDEHHHGGLVGDPQLAFARLPVTVLPWTQTLDGLPVLVLCVVGVVGGGGGGDGVALVIDAGMQQDDWSGAG